MRSETVCERWEAKRKDLFNKLGRSCGCNQIKKKKKMLEEKHTLTKMKTKISKYQKQDQKKTKKQQTERKALVQKDFCILICPGSVQISILHHYKHSPFHSGFLLSSFSVEDLQNIYFSIILYTLFSSSLLAKYTQFNVNVLQLIPHAGYLPTSLFTALK